MTQKITVSRPSYNEEKFHEVYSKESASKNFLDQVKHWKSRKFTCSSKSIWKFLITLFPVLQWLPKYKRKYIVGDLIAGWTVGIIRIPQGMAYALLAGVQPVYGLYSCFFSVLLWFVFSTSKHTSVGTMAVVCLMIQNLIALHIPDLQISSTSNQLLVNGDPVNKNDVPKQYITINEENAMSLDNNSYISFLRKQHELDKINLACSATLLVGIIQLAMALFRLGFLTTLLSDPVIQGFTTGAAFHVLTSQVKYMFGLDKAIGKYNGPLAIFKTYVDIFTNLRRANVADIIITAISLPSLLVVKYLSEKYKKKLRNIPIPIELILVVIGTFVSYFCHLHKPPYNVNIVKTIPTGMPTLSVPTMTNLWPKMVSDCLIMAFISVAISLSLTKIYADKHGYEVDANQEILALGICNTIPAFLSSFAVAASLSRTAIQESTGGKTQLVSVLSSILMLIVLLWLAPLFEPVPKSVLACIIIVALKSLFLQFSNVKALWDISKFDMVRGTNELGGSDIQATFFFPVVASLLLKESVFLLYMVAEVKLLFQHVVDKRFMGVHMWLSAITLVWLVTCSAVVILGVDLGLAVGVAMAVAGLLFRIQHPKHALLGRIIHTDLYADQKKYKDAQELCGIKIFHYADSVSFTNKDAFRSSLYRVLGCNPDSVLAKLKKEGNNIDSEEENRQLLPNQPYNTTSFSKEKEHVRKRGSPSHKASSLLSFPLDFSVLVFDVTMWSFVDWTAAREIMQIIDKFQALNITVLLAGPNANVLRTLDSCGLPSRFTHEHVFVTVHDAAVHAEQLVKARLQKSASQTSLEDLPGYPGYDSLAF